RDRSRARPPVTDALCIVPTERHVEAALGAARGARHALTLAAVRRALGEAAVRGAAESLARAPNPGPPMKSNRPAAPETTRRAAPETTRVAALRALESLAAEGRLTLPQTPAARARLAAAYDAAVGALRRAGTPRAAVAAAAAGRAAELAAALGRVDAALARAG